MSNENLSPLENAILQVFFDEYGNQGFPLPGTIKIRNRENTGAGRYVYLHSSAEVRCEDGYLDMGGRFIEMEGVPNGLMAVVSIENSRLDQLEISTYEEDWDGEERPWKII